MWKSTFINRLPLFSLEPISLREALKKLDSDIDVPVSLSGKVDSAILNQLFLRSKEELTMWIHWKNLSWRYIIQSIVKLRNAGEVEKRQVFHSSLLSLIFSESRASS